MNPERLSKAGAVAPSRIPRPGIPGLLEQGAGLKEFWVWQDCITRDPVGALNVLRCAPQKFQPWTDRQIAAAEYHVDMEKRLREQIGLSVADWLGQPEIREAA